MSKEQELTALLEEGKELASIDISNGPSSDRIRLDMWINKINLFCKNQLSDHELKKEISNACFFKESKGLKVTYESLTALLLSLADHIAKEPYKPQPIAHEQQKGLALFKPTNKKYDVFISHANKDKTGYVDELCTLIKKLGINVFYDTDIFSWGDKWKELIYKGTEQSEFAIIVISENFFDREWTEIELKKFLERQNASGQKIILPLLHNISFEDLEQKYPSLCDIQCIKADSYSKEEICILYAKELIKRLKGI